MMEHGLVGKYTRVAFLLAITLYTVLQTTNGENNIITDEDQRTFVKFFLNTELQQTHTISKWGTDISRRAVALHLYDPQFFATGNETGKEIAYELSLKMILKLVTKKQTSTKDIALFINAMTVACIDPKSFFGVNIVAELRKRVDNSKDTNPFFILTLCNGGEEMKMEDVHKLKQMFDTPLWPLWADTQAMVVMALECISRQSNILNITSTLDRMVSVLKSKQQTNGRIENLKTTALVVQAMIATQSYSNDFNLTMALTSISNDLKHTEVHTEVLYYILPIIKWKTLLDINSNHCANTIKTNAETKEKMHLENQVGKIAYRKNIFGQEFYRKDALGNDAPFWGFSYAKTDNETEIYPKSKNGDEFYLKNDSCNCEVYATRVEDGLKSQYYARKANGDEFYARRWSRRSSSLPNFLYTLVPIQITINVGDDIDFTRTEEIRAPPSNNSFYKALEALCYFEPHYNLQYSLYEGKPFVNGLANFQNSIEDGLFWFIYTKPLSTSDDFVLIKESPVDIKLNETDEMILWYRSGPQILISDKTKEDRVSNVTHVPT